MNRLGFIILSILKANGATGKLTGMSAREIWQAEEMDCKEDTVYRKLKNFRGMGYVENGLRDKRADTFYLTPEGENALERIRA